MRSLGRTHFIFHFHFLPWAASRHGGVGGGIVGTVCASQKASQLVLIVTDVPLHDVHTRAQQPLKGHHVHDCSMSREESNQPNYLTTATSATTMKGSVPHEYRL